MVQYLARAVERTMKVQEVKLAINPGFRLLAKPEEKCGWGDLLCVVESRPLFVVSDTTKPRRYSLDGTRVIEEKKTKKTHGGSYVTTMRSTPQTSLILLDR